MAWQKEHIQNADKFRAALSQLGFNFYTGVPCSLLGALLEKLARDDFYLPAVREDAAVGMASGAYLAGRKPVVLMQNSGLGYSMNVFTSLNLIYKIPFLCIVSYRGFGPDAPEHIVMGRSCEKLLSDIGVEFAAPDNGDLVPALRRADRTMTSKREPYVLLIKRGIFGQ